MPRCAPLDCRPSACIEPVALHRSTEYALHCATTFSLPRGNGRRLVPAHQAGADTDGAGSVAKHLAIAAMVSPQESIAAELPRP